MASLLNNLIILLTLIRVSSSILFSPVDNYLIDCGSSQQTRLTDGRTFKSELDAASLLSCSDQDLRLISAANITTIPSSKIPSSSLPLYTSLRIFPEKATYTFHISLPGTHFLRLYFFPIPNQSHNLSRAIFRVTADSYVLLEDFSVSDHSGPVFREFLVNAGERLSLTFEPKKGSLAFVNAIEVVSAPDSLVPASASFVFPPGASDDDVASHALEVVYRLNVGGPDLGPVNDTLFRTWESDIGHNVFVQGSDPVSVPEKAVNFAEKNGTAGSTTPLTAPRSVYSSAQRMRDPLTLEPNFNMTWNFTVDDGYSYLIRFHFCDIVSLTLDTLFFDVYVNEIEAVSSLDLSSITGSLATAYHRDFVVAPANVTNGTIMVQVGCSGGLSGPRDGILNGLEIMKMSNSAKSLNGSLTVDQKVNGWAGTKILAAVGLGLAVAAAVLLGMAWRRSTTGLLPLQGKGRYSSIGYLSSKKGLFGSRGYSSSYFSASSVCFGRVFTLSELHGATQGFDEKAVIGVGGFGKVYLGVLEDGSKVAVKRGNPSSEQGVAEFRTEIEMLSKLRHRHLVSLIGFCDEQAEMILVYEYMAKGPLRDHLYRADLGVALSWKQRLEICIGAARGLHYLHTGAAQGIIHRDVKTTNILLDDNLLAKVSDFGLSKAAPSLDKTHVSTVVKGSFGYLDPEYFRTQQLTEKSDVYSFGVVLFEVLLARQAIDPKLPREQVSLAEWAMTWHKKGAIEKIVDRRIAGTIGDESLKKFVETAEKCLAEDGEGRPSMGDVLWNLEYALQLQEAATVILGGAHMAATVVVCGAHKDDEEKKKKNGQFVEVCDDSNVSIEGFGLFSQSDNFQGR